MATSNKASLTSKIVHLNIKNHVTLNKGMSIWDLLSIFQDIERNTNIMHLLGYGISPKGITIGFVKLIRMVNTA